MKILFENWRKLLNEISFDDAKKRLETKALTKWIKGMAFDEETKTMTLDPNQIEAAKNELAKLVLEFVPEDLTDNQRGTTLEWLISVGINDPLMKQKFYNEATRLAVNTTRFSAYMVSAMADLRVIRGDLERYWYSHEYSDQKDIFSIKSFADLAVAADRAKRKYDDARRDKEFQDPEKGTEIFDHPYKDEWFIAALHTKAAACHYGKNTDWCTATDTDMFDNYYEPDDPLFYFEHKQHGNSYFNSRWQIHFGSAQFMDEKDHEMPEEERDELIEMLGQTGPAKNLPEFVPEHVAGAAEKYQIVRYWVERTEIMQLIYDENTTDYELLAMADKFVGKGEREVLEAIMERPNVTAEILKFIAENDDDARSIALFHKKFPVEAVEELANSEDDNTRWDAVASGRLSTETLTRLAEDEYWRVRNVVAQNQKTPPEVLAKLVSDENYEGVVSPLLRNKSLPSELFEPLLKRAQEEDAKGAVMPYKTKPVDGGPWKAPPAHLYWSAQVYAAGNPQAPEELLRTLGALGSGDDRWHTRSEVAKNPSTPIDLVQALAKDKSAHVRNTAKRALQVRDFGSMRENFRRFLK